MRIILNPTDTDRALDRIIDQARTLKNEHLELRTRFLTDRDGYPTQSMGSDGSATNELDDDGTPIPQHPDPVGRLVISRDEADDTLGNLLASMVQHIQRATHELEAGIGDAGRARPPIKPTDPDELWCENHLKASMHEPREQGRKLCSWCRHEKLEQKKLPSIRLMQARSRGNITPSLRREIALRDTDDRKARRAKAKRSA